MLVMIKSIHKKGLYAGLGMLFLPITARAVEENAEAIGLPQLDLATWPNQIFWLVVTFVIGYLLMSRLITPRIGTIIEQRQRIISDDIAKARDAQTEAKLVKAEYLARIDQARSGAVEATSTALADAKAKAEQLEAELTARLIKKTKAAEAKLSKLGDEVLAGMDEVACEAAQEIVSRLTGITIPIEEARHSVNKQAVIDAI